MNSINWPTSSVIAQAGRETAALTQRPWVRIPLKLRNPFFRAFSQLLKLRFTAMVTYSFHSWQYTVYIWGLGLAGLFHNLCWVSINGMKRVLIFIPFLFMVVSAQRCRSTYSVQGRYLKNHLICTQNVKDIGRCLVLCSKNQRCKNINFQFRD